MAKGVIRPLKGGGYSICTSPENKIGTGRCRHINGISFNVDNTNGNMVVNIGDKEIKTEEEIVNYIKSIGESIPEEKKKKLLDFYRNYSK